MVQLLKNKGFIGFFTFFIFSILLFLLSYYFLNAETIVSKKDGILYRFLQQNVLLENKTNHYNDYIFYVLHVGIAILINVFVMQKNLLYKDSWLPATFYLIIISYFKFQFTLSSAEILIIGLLLLSINYQRIEKFSTNFTTYLDGGIITGFIYLIDTNVLYYIPFIWISYILLGNFGFKKWMVWILGFLIPIYFTLGIAYAFSDISMKEIFNSNYSLYIDGLMSFQYNYIQILAIALFLFSFFVSISQMRANYYKNTIEIRKSQQHLTVLLLAGLVVVLFNFKSLQTNFIYAIFPISIFNSYYYLKSKKPIYKEIVFLLLLIMLILSYFADSFKTL